MYTIDCVLYTVNYAHCTLFNIKGISWKLNTVYQTCFGSSDQPIWTNFVLSGNFQSPVLSVLLLYSRLATGLVARTIKRNGQLGMTVLKQRTQKLQKQCKQDSPCTKRSRARVTIEGQRVLLQISLKMKMFDFLLNSQNHRMNHIFPGILLNPYP